MNKLDAVYGPTFRTGFGLPGEAFTSENLFKEEARRIFHRSWCCVGLIEDVARANEVCPIELLGQPLLLVHNKNGIEVFHNVCSHRGSLLVAEAKMLGRNRPIICPYHSWTYDLDGTLLRTPSAGGASVHEDAAIDRSTCGLTRVR